MRLASRGLREGERGLEPVQDAEERRLLRRQARAVHVRAALAAAALTAALLALPPTG